MRIRELIGTRIWTPLLNQVRQGVTPERLALSVALGITLGCVPLLGAATPLCLLFGAVLGLNQPAIQAVNYLAYPLQLGLLAAFFQLGNRLFAPVPVALRPDQIVQFFRSDFFGAMEAYGSALLRAGLAWVLVAPVAALLIYGAAAPVFRMIHRAHLKGGTAA